MLVPIFRSDAQLQVLGATYLEPDREFSVPELVGRSSRSQPTIAREVERLAEAGLVISDLRHGRRYVSANVQSPIFAELRALLVKTVGPKAVIEEELGTVSGIERAFIYGSWARRYFGESGPLPEDVDLMVIGAPDVGAVRDAAEVASRRVHQDVNPTILTPAEFGADDRGFISQLKSQPVVELDVAAVRADLGTG
ncbi:winged helix-turn-helix domain-containing protein [Branchiibius sp. NY16-3462-2]|uniref:winged helix-turn-helix domain-containing protein n=1 Tax=Branchiibius sp. NY16-3462-2 TaxID=1807500 RepID=UPI00079242DE|nr:winged helix-turn-helix domain-containing protein [Branchiibius sp. NY16-3462-2]KYH45315.1 hypothetical protein AZH51_05420 [Branchiibius sp. NY16-3462-2]